MSSRGIYGDKPADQGFRRTWDKEEYERRAKLREAGQLKRKGQPESEPAPDAEPGDDDTPFVPKLVKAREGDLGLAASVGKTVVVQTADGTQPGFHCATCDRTYRDNVAYLDHINSLQHLQALGHALRTARSTVEQVRARLLFHKQARVNPAKRDIKAEREERMRRDAAELAARKEERKRRKQEAKQAQAAGSGAAAASEDAGERDPDADAMAAMMGFRGFGSSKAK